MNFDPLFPQVQPIHQSVPDASNPAATAYAQHQLARAVSAHLIQPRSYDSGDPAAAWRAVSARIGSNPESLQSFLAQRRPVAQNFSPPVRYVPGSIDVQAPNGPLPPGQPLPLDVGHLKLNAVLAMLKHLSQFQYRGRH